MRLIATLIKILSMAEMKPASNESLVAEAYIGSGLPSRQLQGHFTADNFEDLIAQVDARRAADEAQQVSDDYPLVASSCKTQLYNPQLSLTLPEKTCTELWKMTPGELTAYLQETGNLDSQGGASAILAPPTWNGGLIVTSATPNFNPCVRTQTPQTEKVYRVFISGNDVFRRGVYTQAQPVDQRCIVPEQPHDWYQLGKDFYWSGGAKPNMVVKASDGNCLEVTTGTAINGPFNYAQANESESICDQYMDLARGAACDESVIEPCPTNAEDESSVVVTEDAIRNNGSRSAVVSIRDRNQTHNNSTDGVRSVVVAEDAIRNNGSRSAGSRGANEGLNSDKGKRKKVNGGEEKNKTMSRLLIAGFAFVGILAAGAGRKITNVMGCSRKDVESIDVEMHPLLGARSDVDADAGQTINPAHPS